MAQGIHNIVEGTATRGNSRGLIAVARVRQTMTAPQKRSFSYLGSCEATIPHATNEIRLTDIQSVHRENTIVLVCSR